MRTVMRYGLVGNMEDAHYVKYAADAAQRAGLATTNGAAAAEMKVWSCQLENLHLVMGRHAATGEVANKKDVKTEGGHQHLHGTLCLVFGFPTRAYDSPLSGVLDSVLCT